MDRGTGGAQGRDHQSCRQGSKAQGDPPACQPVHCAAPPWHPSACLSSPPRPQNGSRQPQDSPGPCLDTQTPMQNTKGGGSWAWHGGPPREHYTSNKQLYLKTPAHPQDRRQPEDLTNPESRRQPDSPVPKNRHFSSIHFHTRMGVNAAEKRISDNDPSPTSRTRPDSYRPFSEQNQLSGRQPSYSNNSRPRFSVGHGGSNSGAYPEDCQPPPGKPEAGGEGYDAQGVTAEGQKEGEEEREVAVVGGRGVEVEQESSL